MRIDLRDVENASKRLAGIAVLTPLLTSLELDEIAGGRVFIKPECLQLTGSFKIRGAYNMMSQLSPEQAARGVVAWSSGNHAQGVASAGSLLGIRTAIVMPEDAPRVKLENTRRLGGEPILYDRFTGDREAIARSIAAERGAELVPSYDHEDIVAGQGTVGLEIMHQCRDLGVTPDQVLVPCGGGGLIAGSAVAIRGIEPQTSVHPVEPEHFDDTARSLRAGERLSNDPSARSICDALQATTPGRLTFEINREVLAGGLVVSDGETRDAMRFTFRNLKLVVEPGGATALAAVLSQKIATKGKVTVVVLSGGNVDADLFASIQRGS
ncbi:MAG: threonine/serine dehydratase [Woeseia sp.]